MMLMSLISMMRPSLGFTSIQSQRTSRAPIAEVGSRSTAIWNSVEPVVPIGVTIEDKNGQIIAVGSIVRVTATNLKAYQVPPSARGIFNDDKKFEPAPDDAPRALQNLAVPVGMRGVVKKITNKVAKLSANFPIQVEFSPGKHVDEGYDPPAPFVMHFGRNEVECV